MVFARQAPQILPFTGRSELLTGNTNDRPRARKGAGDVVVDQRRRLNASRNVVVDDVGNNTATRHCVVNVVWPHGSPRHVQVDNVGQHCSAWHIMVDDVWQNGSARNIVVDPRVHSRRDVYDILRRRPSPPRTHLPARIRGRERPNNDQRKDAQNHVRFSFFKTSKGKTSFTRRLTTQAASFPATQP